jgi:glycosyltransferase involved in cell wall biosynthesis
MRLLYVLSNLDRYDAGQQLALAACHRSDAFEVHLAALRTTGELGAELAAAGLDVADLGQRWPFDPVAAWRLSGLVARLRPDVVHADRPGTSVYARLASFRTAKTPWLFGAADIAPGVAPPTEQPLPRRALTDELGLPESVYLIGLAGRLAVDQGWPEVIWTLDILRCLRDDVHLVVIGDGPQRQQLERFARLCTLDSHVHFLGRRGDVPRILPNFNQLWNGPGSAVAVGEALAAGVPVVASNTAENRQFVIHDQTGFLVPIGSRVERARYANRLLNDPPLRARLSQAGRQRTLAQFDLAQMIDRYAALYRRLAAAPPAKQRFLF